LSEIQRKTSFFFYFRDAAYLRDAVSKVRISENNTKEKTVFLFIVEQKKSAELNETTPQTLLSSFIFFS